MCSQYISFMNKGDADIFYIFFLTPTVIINIINRLYLARRVKPNCADFLVGPKQVAINKIRKHHPPLIRAFIIIIIIILNVQM